MNKGCVELIRPGNIKAGLVLLVLLVMLSSCAMFEQAVNTSKVRFSFDRVGEVRLAGIDITSLQSINELSSEDIIRATVLLSRQQVPLDMTIYIRSENPVVNTMALTLVELEWVLILEGKETARGVLKQEISLPSGHGRAIPIKLGVNLAAFFTRDNTMDLLKLAMAISGAGGKVPQGLALKVRPTIDTAIGPIRYQQILLQPS